MFHRGIPEKGSDDIRSAVCYTISIYLSLSPAAKTTSSEPFENSPVL